MRCWCVWALMATLAGVAGADSTANREIKAVRLSAAPKIDGVLDDAVWKEAATTSGFTDEVLGTPVRDDTTVWLGYDERCIYVAFHAHDSQPGGIVARETKRGSEFYTEDRVRLRVNPFDSRRSNDESELHLNALGTQMAEFAGGRANKQEWEGEWLGAARVVADGWTAEMAVPWKCFVRPQSDGSPTTIGVNFDRYQARTRIKSYWSNLGQQERREFGGRMVGVVMPPSEPSNPLDALVYMYGGYERDRVAARAGLDARYRFTPSFTGVFTANPDFSNVEGAVTSIDFSYAEKLPDERRPFFLEGSSYLASPLYSVRPFASIRLNSLDAGAKFFGRVRAGTDIGVLAAHDTSGRTDAVLNLSHQFSPFDTFLFQGASRSESGTDNQIGVALGRMRRGDWMLQAAHGRSQDRTGPGETTDIYLSWGSKSWFTGLNYELVSRNIQARDGYVRFRDQKGLSLESGYSAQWRTGPFRSCEAMLGGSRYRHLDGSPFRDSVEAYLALENERQLHLGAGFATGTFEGNRDHVFSMSAVYPAQNTFCQYGARYATGRQGGSTYWSFAPKIVWRFFNRLSMGLTSEVVHSGGTDEQHIMTVAYDLSRDQAIGGRIVRRGSRTNGYLSFRKSGYGGTEYFVIMGDPNTERFSERLVLKVVHPL